MAWRSYECRTRSILFSKDSCKVPLFVSCTPRLIATDTDNPASGCVQVHSFSTTKSIHEPRTRCGMGQSQAFTIYGGRKVHPFISHLCSDWWTYFRNAVLSHAAQVLEFSAHSMSTTAGGYTERTEEKVVAIRKLRQFEVWSGDLGDDENSNDALDILDIIRNICKKKGKARM